MIQWPSYLGGKNKLVGWLNKLLGCIKAASVKQVVGGRLVGTSDGQILIVEPGQSGKGGGWTWAEPKEYDPETQYQKNKVVVVSPDSPSLDGVTDGVDGHGPSANKTVAGLYVCLRPPRVTTGEGEEEETAVHVPIWTPPDGDPDSPNNYWWLISLYPQTIELCVDVGGVNTPTPFYIHAQQVPGEFL